MACANRFFAKSKGAQLLILALLSSIGGVLSPPVFLLGRWNPTFLFLFLFIYLFSRSLRKERYPRKVFSGSLLLGFLFGLAQALGIYFFFRSTVVFTPFYILDRFWIVQACLLMGGFLSLFFHASFQREVFSSILYLGLSLLIDFLTSQYFLTKKLFSFLPSRPYLLPFVIILGYFGVSLLYHFRALKMLKIIGKEGNENESV